MLSILTLNINYRIAKHGTWAERRTLIAAAARERQADVMALQAVEGLNGDNQARELAALLGFEHVAFVAAMKDGAGSRGSAFISRYPLRDVTVRQLGARPGDEDPNRRVVLRAEIASRAGRFDLYNAHFSWVPQQALANARETLAFSRGRPALFLGDLNSAPDSPAMNALSQAGWLDLWADLRPTEPGFTFESDQPTQRIDYALATKGVRPGVRAIERVATSGTNGPRLSDHLGLLVTLEENNR